MPIVFSRNNVIALSMKGLVLTFVAGESLLDRAVTEILYCGLELIVTEEVAGPSFGVDGISKLGLKRVNYKTDFNTVVAGKDGAGVNSLKLDGPVADEDNFFV